MEDFSEIIDSELFLGYDKGFVKELGLDIEALKSAVSIEVMEGKVGEVIESFAEEAGKYYL